MLDWKLAVLLRFQLSSKAAMQQLFSTWSVMEQAAAEHHGHN